MHFVSRESQCFPETRETLRFKGTKIHFSPRDQSLSDLLYSKTKQNQILKNALRQQQHFGQHFAGTSELFPV